MLLLRDRSDGDDRIRLGLTVSKKVGNAVVRNRMKRRFRELARLILPESGLKGVDLVLIGRIGGNAIPFATLQADLRQALRRASRAHEGRTREEKIR